MEIALIASLASAAGGTVMQNQAQNKAAKEAANATMAETARQKKMQEEANAIFEGSLKKAQPGEQAVDTDIARQKRAAAYTSVVTPGENIGYAPVSGGSSAPQVIQNEFKGAGNRAAAYGKQQGEARAAIDAYGDNALLNSIFGGRQIRKIGQISTNMNNSANVLNSELAAARSKGTSALGDLLVNLGKAGISASAGAAFGAPGVANGPPTNIVPSAMSSAGGTAADAFSGFSDITLGGLY
jgi:hypothetical protein